MGRHTVSAPNATLYKRGRAAFLHAQVEYDIFEAMASRGLHYGYTQLSSENPKMADGMWEFAQDYAHTHLMEEEQARAERNQVRMRGRHLADP